MSNSANKQPTHTAYYLQNKEGIEKPEWIKVGVAWAHQDGKGFNMSLTSLGHEVPVVLRANKPKPE